MSVEIAHLILTRFNVASPGREEAIRLRPGWLANRFKLFETYCLPSVASQSRQDFQWIIYFDEKTPLEFRREIERLQCTFPFRTEFTRLFHMPEIVPKLLVELGEHRWLLTSRLDSDDILAIDYVARLRREITHLKRQVINFKQGAILATTANNPKLFRSTDHSNPFAALLEPASRKAKTIWGEKHVDLGKMAPVVQVLGRPAWLQVVHGGNVSNRIKGHRVHVQHYVDIFPYLGTLIVDAPETSLEIASENGLLKPLRFFREILRVVAKRLVQAIPSVGVS